MELFQALGLNIKILIAQLVNFAVLLLVLWKFGYKPMMKFLDERTKKIETGVKNFEEAQKRLVEIDAKEKQILKKAQQEAQLLIEKTNEKITQRKKDMMAKAKEEIDMIVKKTKEDLEVEKKITLKHIKQESVELIIAVAEKILGDKINAKLDKDFIDKAIKDFSKEK